MAQVQVFIILLFFLFKTTINTFHRGDVGTDGIDSRPLVYAADTTAADTTAAGTSTASTKLDDGENLELGFKLEAEFDFLPKKIGRAHV